MKPHVVAVIQARMGSTRLPGKVLRPIAGQPLLWHVLHRLRKSHWIGESVVATSSDVGDDPIVEFCRTTATRVVRGEERDVLSCFARAAELTDADIVVGVCADAPFIDSGYIDRLVDALVQQQADFVQLEEGGVTAHEGVDVFSRHGLDKLMMDAAADPVAREQVAGYFRLHMDFVPVARARTYLPLAKNVGRLTVDTPDDLTFVESVHARLEAQAGEATLADLLLLLEREPALRKIHVQGVQKGIAPQGRLALIRCDAGAKYGFDHAKRMIALARALRDREGIGCFFAVNGPQDGLTPILKAGFAGKCLEGPNADLSAVVPHPDLLVLDCCDGPSLEALELLHIPLKVAVNDISDRRLACDLAYYPPTPQAFALDWAGAHCEPRIGWKWALFGPIQAPARPRSKSPCPALLVTVGNSDPANLTERCAHALKRLDPVFRARFVIGSHFPNKDRLARSIVRLSPNFETVEGADGLSTEYAACDVALASFGVTAYELAAFGVPTLYLSLSADDARSASSFEEAGIGINLGTAAEADDKTVAKAVWDLLNDGTRRRGMHAAGLTNVDGLGTHRTAADLAAALSMRQALSREAI